MLGIISGIVGLISFFTGLKSVLFICAIANFLGQLLMVISKQQKSLSTITGFSILGFLISRFCETPVLEGVALFVCIEAVMMEIIFPVLFIMTRKQNKRMQAMNRSIDDKRIKRMYKEVERFLLSAHITPIFIDKMIGFSFPYCCDINEPLESGASVKYKIELDENDNNYKCIIAASQHGNIPTNQTLEQYNANINDIFYNELQGAVFSINKKADKPFIELIRIITINDTRTAAFEIVSSINDMIEVSKKRYSRRV